MIGKFSSSGISSWGQGYYYQARSDLPLLVCHGIMTFGQVIAAAFLGDPRPYQQVILVRAPLFRWG